MYNIKPCKNEICMDRKNRLDLVAPPYRLEDRLKLARWRDWALTFISCWTAQQRWRHRYDWPQSPSPGQLCADFLKSLTQHPQEPDFLGPNSFGPCELLHWVFTITLGLGLGLSPDYPIRHILGEGVTAREAIRTMSEKKISNICPHRLWNVAIATNGRAVEVASISSMLEGIQLSEHHLSKHGNCTVQACRKNDETTTAVPQLHVCTAKDCPKEVFPIQRLNECTSFEGGSTAWSIPHGSFDPIAWL